MPDASQSLDDRIRNVVERVDALGTGGEYTVSWSGPVDDAAIQHVERLLGVRLPASYKAFARLVGGDGLDVLPISSIRPEGDRYGVGTLWSYSDTYREDWVPFPLPSHLVVVQYDRDHNDPFCLDTSVWAGDECPVVLYELQYGHSTRAAGDFITFLEKEVSGWEQYEDR